jgi:hypothetical protein
MNIKIKKNRKMRSNKIIFERSRPISKNNFNLTSSTLASKPFTHTFQMSSNTFYQQDSSLLQNNFENKKNDKKLNHIKKKLGLSLDNKPIKITTTEPTFFSSNKKYIKPPLGPLKRKNSFIPFTKIKSPFSNEGREINLYKKIFYFFREKKKKFARDIKLIHNKLNLEYAETDEQFDQMLAKYNIELIKKGEKIKHFSGPTFSEIQLKDLQQKVKFMKSVVDYTYPDMVLFKVKQTEKLLKIKNENYKVLEPFKRTDLNNKNNENLLKEYLNRAIKITKV